MRIAAAALTAAVSLAAAGAAQAATLSVDHQCYVSEGSVHQSVAFNGTGYTPGATATVTAGGQTLGQLAVSPQGTISQSFKAPGIVANQKRYSLSASDGTNTASTSFYVTRARADFFPSNGNPATLRVRFYVIGLGAVLAASGKASNSTVYAHWKSPSGSYVGVKRLGKLSGPCGSLISAKQRALPFGSKRGLWKLRFNPSGKNTSAGFATTPWVSIGLRVRIIF